MKNLWATSLFCSLMFVCITLQPGGAADVSKTRPLLARIKAVSREGDGNAEAAKAWRELVQLGPAALIDILNAMDDENLATGNWLRPAADAICERELAAGRSLPAEKLEAFVLDTRHAGTARRLAYEWLRRVDATAPARLLPGMLNDPGAELRRDAVARTIDEAKKLLKGGDKIGARQAFRTVFAASRDADQVNLIAKELKSLGIEVNLPAHLGFIQKWMVIGPFDNGKGAGFDKVYMPEKRVALNEALTGNGGMQLRWVEHTTADPYGMVDLNKALGKHMGVVGYGFAAIESPRERPIEIRVGSNNAIKIFLNGKQVFFREEYHHGMRMDQYAGRGTLKAGRNEVLIKVCQNEQKDDWAQKWGFQLRVCDALGGNVPMKLLAEKTSARPTEGAEQ